MRRQKNQRPARGNKRSEDVKKHVYIAAYGGNAISPTFQPRWLKAKLRYSDTITVTMSAASYSAYIFNANSLFDPDRTGTGHQPRGYDQLTPLYNRYRVDNVSYVVEFGPSTADYSACVGLVNGSNSFTTVGDLAEASKASARVVPYSGNAVRFSGKISNWRALGRSRLAYHTDDTTGSVNNTSPAELIELHIVTQNPTAGSVFVVYTVTLSYESVFYDYIVPGAS